MTCVRSFLLWPLVLIILLIAGDAHCQGLQASARLLSLDFNRESKWNPLSSDLSFPSGGGIFIGVAKSRYLTIGGDFRMGQVTNATDELIRDTDGESIFALTGVARVQHTGSRFWLKPFLQLGIGGQLITNEDGLKPNINLGAGVDVKLYRNIYLNIGSSFTREISRNRYFLDYGVGLTFSLFDDESVDEEVQDVMMANRNDFDSDGIADVDDDCPDLAGPLASNGCPDGDGDGVADHLDNCPDQAGLASEDGCPIAVAHTDPLIEFPEDSSEMVNIDQGSDDTLNLNAKNQDNTDNIPELNLTETTHPPVYRDTTGEVATMPLDSSETQKSGKEDYKDFEITEATHPPVYRDTTVEVATMPLDSSETQKGNDEEYKDLVITEATHPPVYQDTTIQTIDSVKSREVGSDEKEVALLEDEPKNLDNQNTLTEEDKDETDSSVGQKDVVDNETDAKGDKSQKGMANKEDSEEKAERFIDTDGDGIADKIDPCPKEAGTLVNMGCPESQEAKGTLGVAENSSDGQTSNGSADIDFRPIVRFPTGLASIQPEYTSVIREVANFMQANQEYGLKIFGHTDSEGVEGLNDVLAKRRAKACFLYLEHLGVDSDRMDYNGYGEYRPVADNTTSEGKMANRRVVFELFTR